MRLPPLLSVERLKAVLPEPSDRRDLDVFEARLEAAKAKHAPEPKQVVISALGRGTRHAFEIAATTVVGAALGWWLDRWLGTAPWGFLLLLLLGVAAGFWNLLKAVNAEVAAGRQREQEAAAALADDAGKTDLGVDIDRQGPVKRD